MRGIYKWFHFRGKIKDRNVSPTAISSHSVEETRIILFWSNIHLIKRAIRSTERRRKSTALGSSTTGKSNGVGRTRPTFIRPKSYEIFRPLIGAGISRK